MVATQAQLVALFGQPLARETPRKFIAGSIPAFDGPIERRLRAFHILGRADHLFLRRTLGRLGRGQRVLPRQDLGLRYFNGGIDRRRGPILRRDRRQRDFVPVARQRFVLTGLHMTGPRRLPGGLGLGKILPELHHSALDGLQIDQLAEIHKVLLDVRDGLAQSRRRLRGLRKLGKIPLDLIGDAGGRSERGRRRLPLAPRKFPRVPGLPERLVETPVLDRPGGQRRMLV